MSCPFESICKHKDRVEAELQWLNTQTPLKVGADPSAKPERQIPLKTHRGQKPKYYSLTTKDKDIKKARIILKSRKVDEMLSAEQVKALDTYKGIHTKNLTEAQREQIISILRDSNRR